jgi:fatty-acyl-CoA synthase
MQDIEVIEARGVPDLPPSSYELIRRGAEIDPDAPALSFFLTVDEHRRPERWTYRELLARITQTANFFHRLGAKKDTVIAFVLPNLPETHFVIWGGQATGIVVALNPLLEGAALGALLEAARAEILVTLAPFVGTDLWRKLQPTLARQPSLGHVVLVNLGNRVPGIKGIAARVIQRLKQLRQYGLSGMAGAVPKHVRVHDFSTSIRNEEARQLVSRRVFSASDPSSWFCTGGTTGLPKLAMRTHGNEVANAWSVAQMNGDGIGPRKVVFCGLPLFHVNAVLVTGLLPFSRGAHVILGTPQGYRSHGLVQRFWEIVEHHRVNLFSGVPTLYSSLLQVPIGSHDVSTLEYGLCGAAPLPTEVFRAFEARTGVKLLEGYGLTEATCVSSANPPNGERRVGSIGLRVPGQRMKCVVLDERGAYVRDCAVDEVGVVVVAGPNVFAGYRDSRHDVGLWIDCGDGERWLNTGDLARRDADGYFWLTGRKKELIIRGGHNIDPAAIEHPLHRHPAVQIAAAVGRPDARAGELPVVYVQLKKGTSASEGDLADFLRRELTERAAIPKHVRIVDEMPLTAVGKIFKPALKRREAKDALEDALREAGVSFRSLDITDEPSRGMSAHLQLDAHGSEAAVRRVLGLFTVPFTISAATRQERSP